MEGVFLRGSGRRLTLLALLQFAWFTSTRVQILTPEELRFAAVGVFLEKLNVYKATADVEAGLEMYKRYTEERLKHFSSS